MKGTLGIFLLFLCASAFAGSPVVPPLNIEVINESAMVYERPDFNSPVMAEVKGGEVYEASNRKFGTFHRIRLKDGRTGYLSEADMAPKSNGTSKKKSEPRRKKRPFEDQRLRGPELVYLNFRESTMQLKPTEGLLFYGVKLTGPDLGVEGDLQTDVNFLIKWGAPNYYQQATGNNATGWIFIADMLFQMVTPQSKGVVTFYGFGPLFKYSQFDTSVSNGVGGSNSFSLQDIVIGLGFNLGIGVKVSQDVAVRGEFKYLWEKMMYGGVGLSLLWEM